MNPQPNSPARRNRAVVVLAALALLFVLRTPLRAQMSKIDRALSRDFPALYALRALMRSAAD